ncbi:MAG: biotin/lipoyl-containing protein, partial [Gammaproteobacteria bacterium]
MGKQTEIKVPDIGDFKDVEIIDILVKKGDQVEVEDSLISLESDKATIDIPSPAAGKIKEIKVKTGDRVSEGDLIILLEESASASETESSESPPAGGKEKKEAPAQDDVAKDTSKKQKETSAASEQEIKVPDIGDFKEVEVIDVLVKTGDKVEEETPLISLESDKATMDIPSPYAGTISKVLVKTGDKVAEGKA